MCCRLDRVTSSHLHHDRRMDADIRWLLGYLATWRASMAPYGHNAGTQESHARL